MKTQTLTERIKKYEAERATLEASHNATVKQFEQILANNRTRYAQITGAIIELNRLKVEFPDDQATNGEQPELVIDRVL